MDEVKHWLTTYTDEYYQNKLSTVMEKITLLSENILFIWKTNKNNSYIFAHFVSFDSKSNKSHIIQILYNSFITIQTALTVTVIIYKPYSI